MSQQSNNCTSSLLAAGCRSTNHSNLTCPPPTIVAVQIGFKGRHYGLFKPAPVAAKPAAKPALKKPPSIFSLDDDEPLDMKAQLDKEMERKKKAKQVRRACRARWHTHSRLLWRAFAHKPFFPHRPQRNKPRCWRMTPRRTTTMSSTTTSNKRTRRGSPFSNRRRKRDRYVAQA